MAIFGFPLPRSTFALFDLSKNDPKIVKKQPKTVILALFPKKAGEISVCFDMDPPSLPAKRILRG